MAPTTEGEIYDGPAEATPVPPTLTENYSAAQAATDGARHRLARARNDLERAKAEFAECYEAEEQAWSDLCAQSAARSEEHDGLIGAED